MQQHDGEWLTYFASRGYPDTRPLAAGMEGAVYQLDDDLVAKVWGDRTEPDLVRLQRFYEHIHRADLAFATPRIRHIWSGPGRWVTVEPKLSGTPLDSPDLVVSQDRAILCMVDVLASLATVPDSPELRAMPALDEPAALWSGADHWSAALSALVRRRTDRFGGHLRATVADFDRKLDRLTALLADTDDVPVRLLHGDLIPANVLVDDTLRPVAVLDFGFLSTAGDPAFDAAVTASIYDMYGEHARQIEARIDDVLVIRFGYPRERLALYRAAYACVTSNAYDPDGRDGHFRWCVDMLGRDSAESHVPAGRRRLASGRSCTAGCHRRPTGSRARRPPGPAPPCGSDRVAAAGPRSGRCRRPGRPRPVGCPRSEPWRSPDCTEHVRERRRPRRPEQC